MAASSITATRPRPSRPTAPPAAASIASARSSVGASCSTWPAPSGATCSSRGTPSCRTTSMRPARWPGSAVEPGDIVLVRTGQMVHLRPDRRDLVAYTWPSPGLTIETAEWFHRHDVAAVATDTLVFEVYPSQHDDLYLPVHLLHLVEMGLTQGQNWVLDALADDCAARRALHLPARRHPAAVDPGARHAAQPDRPQIGALRRLSPLPLPLRLRAVAPPAPVRCAASCSHVVGSPPAEPVARSRPSAASEPAYRSGCGSGCPRIRSRSGAPTRWRTSRRACPPRPSDRRRRVSRSPRPVRPQARARRRRSPGPGRR